MSGNDGVNNSIIDPIVGISVYNDDPDDPAINDDDGQEDDVNDVEENLLMDEQHVTEMPLSTPSPGTFNSDINIPSTYVQTAVHNYDTFSVFDKVRAGLIKNQTVAWDSALKSFEKAATHFNEESTMSFIRDCFYQVCCILLDQQVHKIGPSERNCVERCMNCAINILLQLFKMGRVDNMRALCAVLDSQRPFYRGIRSSHWNYNCGASEVRIRIIRKFHDEGGFVYLMKILETSNASCSETDPKSMLAGWLGVENTRIIVQALQECKHDKIHDSNTHRLCKLIMKHVLLMTEEELKRENSEYISDIAKELRVIMSSYGSSANTEVFDFWLELTLKYLKSGSLPLRLFGWEQVPDLHLTAAESKPAPREYIVRGAGSAEINGRYLYTGQCHDLSPKYVMERIGRKEDGTLLEPLTLFRCTMRNKTKVWFISIADLKLPGSDMQDIDYYQCAVEDSDEQEPPRFGWTSKGNNRGEYPPPRLEPRNRLMPEGQTEDDLLEIKLAKWAIENKIVEEVFGSRIHREVVSRSTSLLRFLSRLDGYLTTEHIDLIWVACVGKAETELQAEVYSLLAVLSQCADPDLVVYMINKIHMSVKGEVGLGLPELNLSNNTTVTSNSTASTAAFMEAVEFVQKLASIHAQNFLWYSRDVGTSVLNLLWSILLRPGEVSLKAGEAIMQFFGTMLRAFKNSSRQKPQYDNILGAKIYKHQNFFVRECLNKIIERGLDGEVVLGESEESQIGRLLQLTRFIFDTFELKDVSEVVCELADSATCGMRVNLQQLLLAEFKAFRTRYPKRVGKHIRPELAEDILLEQVNQRLEMLRFVHGASVKVKLNKEQLECLWHILQLPRERELYLAFLLGASEGTHISNSDQISVPLRPPQPATKHQPLLAAFELEELSFAFSELICKRADWTHLGPQSYSCFHAFFTRLRDSSMQMGGGVLVHTPILPSLSIDFIHKLGIDSLWKIVLSTRDAAVADLATRDLLNFYRKSTGPEADEAERDLIKSIFDRLRTTLSELTHPPIEIDLSPVASSSNDATATQSSHVKTQRLLKLLREAIECADGYMSPEHGMRTDSVKRTVTISTRHQIKCGPLIVPEGIPKLKIIRSREGNAYNDLEVFSMELHPLDTVATFKSRIIQRCGKPSVPYNIRLMIRHGMKLLNVDKTPVLSFGVEDGADIICNLSSKMNTQGTSMGSMEVSSPVGNYGLSGTELNGEIFNIAAKTHIGDTIASQDGYFDVLFGLLEYARAAQDQSTVSAVWGLLMKLPTDTTLLNRVKAQVLLDDDDRANPISENSWADLLSAKPSLYKLVYVLQIVDSLLVPAAPLKHQSWAKDYAQFKEGFINSEGLKAVVQTLFMIPCDGDSGYIWVHSLALRVIRTCFTRMPLYDPTYFALQTDESGNTPTGSSKVADNFEKLSMGGESSATTWPSWSWSDVYKQDNWNNIVQCDHEGVESVVGIRLVEFLERIMQGGLVAQFAAIALSFDLSKLLISNDHLNGQLPTCAKLLLSVNSKQGLIDMDKFSKGIDSFTLNRSIQYGLELLKSAVEQFPHAVTEAMQSSKAKNWVVFVLLCNRSVKVRESMCDFVAELGKLDSSIIIWLVHPLLLISPQDDLCAYYFVALDKVLQQLVMASGSNLEVSENIGGTLKILGHALSAKLLSLPRESDYAPPSSSRNSSVVRSSGSLVLRSTLILLSHLLKAAPDGTFPLAGSELGNDLIGIVFNTMLFALPKPSFEGAVHPVCESNTTRAAAFQVLLAAAQRDIPYSLSRLVSSCSNIINTAASGIKNNWNVEIGPDISRGGSGYVGLKNQGCTCYMNSLLQQLFMVPAFRDAICSAEPTPRSAEATLPDDPEKWIGRKLLIHLENDRSAQATVLKYHPELGMHTIQYHTNHPGEVQNMDIHPDDPDVGPMAMYVLRSGRLGKETGLFTPFPPLSKDSEEENTRQLLEQVQRTFCFLSDSQKRFLDPRPLVEVCRCLNLQYPIYHQNDASEFCTKLLDRLETAVVGESGKALANCFGGRLVQEKIPRGCTHRTSREDPFIALELIIRGKESIQESLAALVEGELMEGDNKVECEACGTKKDSMRRTSLGSLPNLLILHLKRFDLDYNTFETVKLNNRCEFPLTLNVKPYTSVGIEEKEALQMALDNAVSSNGGDLTLEELQNLKQSHSHSQHYLGDQMVTEIDLTSGAPSPEQVSNEIDYLYELNGILVHAGVANGGHYYSFIKDQQSRVGIEPRWFKFDDDEVLPFDPANIETCCFGGVGPSTHTINRNNTTTPMVMAAEQERSANALMLFYEKVKPRQAELDSSQENQPNNLYGFNSDGNQVIQKNRKLSKSCEGFMKEVWLDNSQHLVQVYVLDRYFHAFVTDLIELTLDVTSACTPSMLDTCSRYLGSGSKRKEMSPSLNSSIEDMQTDEKQSATSNHHEMKDIRVLRSNSIAMGLNILVDIILHAGDRNIQGTIHLQKMLSEALLTDFNTCSAFAMAMLPSQASPLHHNVPVTTASMGYLRQYIFDCLDVDSRVIGCRMFADAMHALAEFPTSTSDPSKLIVEQLLKQVMDQLIEVPVYHKHGEQVFLMIKLMASRKGMLRNWMVAENVLAKISMFVYRHSAPKNLRRKFQTLFCNQSTPISPSQQHIRLVDYTFVPEVIAWLIGLQVTERAELIQEVPGQKRSDLYLTSDSYLSSINDHVLLEPTMELTPAAKQVFTEIFKKHKGFDDGMDATAIWQYMHFVRTPHPDQSAVKAILTEYNTLEGGRSLSLTGFLDYYKTRIISSIFSDQIWFELAIIGYGPDLNLLPSHHDALLLKDIPPTFDRSLAISASATGVFKEGSTDFSDFNPDLVPDLSLEALCNHLFYDSMVLRTAGWGMNICMGIAKKVCTSYHHRKSSNMLLQSFLEYLSRPQVIPKSGFPFDGHPMELNLEVFSMIVSIVLCIDDEFQKERFEFVLRDSPNALLNAGGHLKALNQLGDYSGSNRSIIESDHQNHVIISVIEQVSRGIHLLLDECKAFRQYISNMCSKEELDWINKFSPTPFSASNAYGTTSHFKMYQGIENEIDGNSEVDYFLSDAEPIRAFIIEGAGVPEINGEYVLHETIKCDEANIYTKEIMFHGEYVEFMLFRCHISNGHGRHQWFISIITPGHSPGTSNDIDFYEAPSQFEFRPELYPPTLPNTWQPMPEVPKRYADYYKTLYPGPTVIPVIDFEAEHQPGEEADVSHRSRNRTNINVPSRSIHKNNIAIAPTSSVQPRSANRTLDGTSGLPNSPIETENGHDLYPALQPASRYHDFHGGLLSPNNSEVEIDDLDSSSLRAEGDRSNSDASNILEDINSPDSSPYREEPTSVNLPPSGPLRNRGKIPHDEDFSRESTP